MWRYLKAVLLELLSRLLQRGHYPRSWPAQIFAEIFITMLSKGHAGQERQCRGGTEIIPEVAAVPQRGVICPCRPGMGWEGNPAWGRRRVAIRAIGSTNNLGHRLSGIKFYFSW